MGIRPGQSTMHCTAAPPRAGTGSGLEQGLPLTPPTPTVHNTTPCPTPPHPLTPSPAPVDPTAAWLKNSQLASGGFSFLSTADECSCQSDDNSLDDEQIVTLAYSLMEDTNIGLITSDMILHGETYGSDGMSTTLRSIDEILVGVREHSRPDSPAPSPEEREILPSNLTAFISDLDTHSVSSLSERSDWITTDPSLSSRATSEGELSDAVYGNDQPSDITRSDDERCDVTDSGTFPQNSWVDVEEGLPRGQLPEPTDYRARTGSSPRLLRRVYKSLESLFTLGKRDNVVVPIQCDDIPQESQSLDEGGGDFDTDRDVTQFDPSKLRRRPAHTVHGSITGVPFSSPTRLSAYNSSNESIFTAYNASQSRINTVAHAPLSHKKHQDVSRISCNAPEQTGSTRNLTRALWQEELGSRLSRGTRLRGSRRQHKMMSGWSSLSGHLLYKGGGVLLRLKGNRRLWWALKDNQSQLVGYRSRDDAGHKRQAMVEIELMGAGITLNPKEKNQFVIITAGKEHFFTADNHESLMVWLVGLQARRDARARTEYGKMDLGGDGSEEEFEILECPGESITPVQSGERQVRAYTTSTLDLYEASRDVRQRQEERRNVADSVDAGLDLIYRDNATSYEDINATFGGYNGGRRSTMQFGSATMSCYNSTGNELDYDNVFSCPEGDLITASRERRASAASDGVMSFNSMTLASSRRIRKDTFSDYRIGSPTGDIQMRSATQSVTRSASSDSQSDILQQLYDMEQQLIATKQEMAKMMNKETCFREVLNRKDNVILELDERLTDMELHPSRHTADKKLREEIRELHNQRRFLNEEVRRLVTLRHQEQNHMALQNQDLEEMKSEVDHWKRDYVFLLQSCITVPTGDIVDGMEVNLYGGNIHKERIKVLLDEARVINPTLPTYNQLCESDIHIDQYGFKHRYAKEGLLLHYICQQLHLHYLHNLTSYEQHQRDWVDLLRKSGTSLPHTKELKVLGRGGIPPRYRQEVWHKLVHSQVQDIIHDKGPHYYSHLVNMAYESKDVGLYRKQIMLDLLRTMPHNVSFGRKEAEGIRRMREVLQAFAMHNPDIGYCQGLNFIAGMCLLILETEDAFWMLVAITEKYFSPNYFDHNLTGALADQEVLQDLMKEKLPQLTKHFHDLDIDVSTVTLNWFLAVFFDAVPFETLLRLWDCFLIEGPKVLFRVSLAILKANEPGLLAKRETISIMRHLKCCSRLIYDANGLIKTAFEELKPFPTRRDIAAKQVVYVNALKDKIKKKAASRRSFAQQDDLQIVEADRITATTMLYECAIECTQGVIWMSLGDQHSGRICVMNCQEGLARSLNIPLDARVMCMCALEQELCIAGTLSGDILALSVNNRSELWRLHLKDSVLSLCCAVYEQTNLVYAGLGDGSVAVLQQVQPKELQEEPVYVQTGRSPVTSLLMIGSQLWAGCGSVIHILNAGTLDPINRVTVTPSILDHIMTMIHQPGRGVWVTIKGSSIVELWDDQQLTCKLIYDVKHFKPVPEKKDDEFKLNKNRISAILPVDEHLWLGTGDGTLLIFEIAHRKQNQSKQIDVPISKTHVTANPANQVVNGSSKYGGAVDLDAVAKKVSELEMERYGLECITKSPLSSPGENIAETRTVNGIPKVLFEVGDTPTHLPEHKRKPLKYQLAKQDGFDTRSPTDHSSLDSGGKSNGSCNGDHPDAVSPGKISNRNKDSPLDEKEFQCESPMPEFRKQLHTKTALKPVESLVTGTSITATCDDNTDKTRPTNVSPPKHHPVNKPRMNYSKKTSSTEKHFQSMSLNGSSYKVSKSDTSELLRASSEERHEYFRNKSQSLSCISEAFSGHSNKHRHVANRKSRSARQRVPEVNIQDSSTSQSPDSDNEYSYTSRGSTPVAIPRSPQYEERNNTPLQQSDRCFDENWTSLGPWDVVSENKDETSRSPNRLGGKRVRSKQTGNKSPNLVEKKREIVDSYPFELILLAKIKVADRPIRCLVKSRCGRDVVVISCAGCSGDDEAVLMWKQGADKMWSNEPMTEVCPVTNIPQRPSYVRTRSMLRSRTTSTKSSDG